MEKLRKALSTMDDGCVNTHFSYLGLDAEHSLELCGHPIPCASGGCGSILRLVRAALVHYPRLQSFFVSCTLQGNCSVSCFVVIIELREGADVKIIRLS